MVVSLLHVIKNLALHEKPILTKSDLCFFYILKVKILKLFVKEKKYLKSVLINFQQFTWGKSCTAACVICMLESSFFPILYARIVFEVPNPATNDLCFIFFNFIYKSLLKTNLNWKDNLGLLWIWTKLNLNGMIEFYITTNISWYKNNFLFKKMKRIL
jgi:hypothetical protein